MPYFTSDHWTGELEGLWTDTETDTRTAGDTAIDMDGVYGAESETDTGKAERQQPARYEDALKAYVQGDTRFSAKPDVRTGSPDAAPNADPTAGPDISRETAPKPKDQVIAELAPKLQKPGTTPGRAMILAEQTYADAEKRFGPDAQTVLEQLQPRQDPRRFLDGFHNAYILGKQGAGPDALRNSSAATYLTDSQRAGAYALGEQGRQGLENSGKTDRIAPEGVAADPEMPYSIPLRRDVKKAIIERGIRAKDTVFTYDTAKNPLATYARRIPKMEGFYDVVMHGTDTAVWFFETKIDAYTLAQIIRQRPDYKKGTPIRLLACNTGNTDNTGDCVAQLLANELDVKVLAPTDLLMVDHDGTIGVGKNWRGTMEIFYSRE